MCSLLRLKKIYFLQVGPIIDLWMEEIKLTNGSRLKLSVKLVETSSRLDIDVYQLKVLSLLRCSKNVGFISLSRCFKTSVQVYLIAGSAGELLALLVLIVCNVVGIR